MHLFELYCRYRKRMDSQNVDYDWTDEELLDFFKQTIWEEGKYDDLSWSELTLEDWLEFNEQYEKRGNYTR